MQHRRISLPEGGKAIQSCSSKTAWKNLGHHIKVKHLNLIVLFFGHFFALKITVSVDSSYLL